MMIDMSSIDINHYCCTKIVLNGIDLNYNRLKIYSVVIGIYNYFINNYTQGFHWFLLGLNVQMHRLLVMETGLEKKW